MQKVNLSQIAEHHRQSPKGKYERYSKNISLALGREAASTIWPSGIRSIWR